jgi:hypothetical protein
MSDISLLPEGLRGNEQSVQKQKPPAPPVEQPGLKMHVPSSMADEDIEIIEVDESDLGAILADEPLFTRLSYQMSAALDSLKQKLFQEKSDAPPPKLPPQFFTPPKAGLVTKAPTAEAGKTATGAAGAAGASRPHTRITPSAETPRRVRVIRRIRKPVRITLLSPEEIQAYRADIPRRKWTLVVCSGLFALIIGGGYWLLTARVADARFKAEELNAKLVTIRENITKKEQEWSHYRDLQTRLIVLHDLLDKHIITSRVFDFLERWTIPDVSYQNASWATDGTLALSVTAKSFSAAARQLVAFQRSAIVQDVSSLAFASAGGADAAAPGAPRPAGSAAAESSVSFQVILKLNPQAFHGPVILPGLSPQPTATSTAGGSASPVPAQPTP